MKACEKAEEKENLPNCAVPRSGDAPSREAVRSSRQAATAAKNRAAYMKSGARLVRKVEQVVDIIKTEVEKGDLTSISFMFGATHLSPRWQEKMKNTKNNRMNVTERTQKKS